MSGIDLMQALFSKSNNDLWIVEDDLTPNDDQLTKLKIQILASQVHFGLKT